MWYNLLTYNYHKFINLDSSSHKIQFFAIHAFLQSSSLLYYAFKVKRSMPLMVRWFCIIYANLSADDVSMWVFDIVRNIYQIMENSNFILLKRNEKLYIKFTIEFKMFDIHMCPIESYWLLEFIVAFSSKTKIICLHFLIRFYFVSMYCVTSLHYTNTEPW